MEKKFLDESTLTYLRNYIDGQDKVIYKAAADLISSTHLESLTHPTTQPTSQLIPSITTSNEQQNLTIGDGLAIENGVLKTTYPNIYTAITFETGSTTKGTILPDYADKLLGLNGFLCYNPNEGGNGLIYRLDSWGIKNGKLLYIFKAQKTLSVSYGDYISTITISNGDGVDNLEITQEYPTRVFEPTINSVSISNDDTNKQLTFNFNVSNFEIITYLTTLIENDKPFTETLYLKTPSYESYQMMFNTPLSLVNASTNVGLIYHCFNLTQNATTEIKCIVAYDEDIQGPKHIVLSIIFSNEEAYTGYKQLASSLFTNDTKIKITIKTDE